MNPAESKDKGIFKSVHPTIYDLISRDVGNNMKPQNQSCSMCDGVIYSYS